MTFPRIDRTGAVPMLITGRRIRDDGTAGCEIGYQARDPEGELDRLRELDRWEPRFSKAVLDRDYGLSPNAKERA